MALLDRLPGVLTRQVGVGAYLTGDPAGSVHGGRVTAHPMAPGFVVHLATGDATRLVDQVATFDAQGRATLALIRSDTPGLNVSGTGFDWVFTVELTWPDGTPAPSPAPKRVRVNGGTGALDLETQPSVGGALTPDVLYLTNATLLAALSPISARLGALESASATHALRTTTDALAAQIAGLNATSSANAAALATKASVVNLAAIAGRVADLEASAAAAGGGAQIYPTPPAQARLSMNSDGQVVR